MSERFINNRVISKVEAYDRAINFARQGKSKESELWFDIIENWQLMPTKDEYERYLEYRGQKKDK
jgi:hypothetical protein